MIDRSLAVWFVLTAISALYVAWDAFRDNPEMGVMKWGFILITLFMGPIGACIYVLSCKPPVPKDHAQFVNPLWKQAVGSTIHCLAGDATGIIAAAAITMSAGLVMWHDLIAEYALGSGFGLFVFQALFTRRMLGGSYSKALFASVYPEWVSMNAVMAGMIPVMVILMTGDMASMHPSSIRFWGVMSLASIVGFFTAYPVNFWLVAVKLKHGMGTSMALGKGGHAMDAEMRMDAGMQMDSGMDMEKKGGQLEVGPSQPASSKPQRWAMAILTLVGLWGGIMLAGSLGDLQMSPRGAMADMSPSSHEMSMPSNTK